MIKILLLLLAFSCSHQQVSVDAAADQAQMSYLKGCTEAHASKSEGPTFEQCREKSKAHRLELDELMDYNE
jgi:hypothetical protein